MSSHLLCVVAFVCVVYVSSQEIYEYDIIRDNPSGLCNMSNTHCDIYVGAWNFVFYLNSFSSPSNGVTIVALDQSSLRCTSPYQINAYCIFGYREEDGAFVSSCFWLPSANYYDTTVNQTKKTLGYSQNSIHFSFGQGDDFLNLNHNYYGCTPMRLLTTDVMIGSMWDSFSDTYDSNQRCPNQPLTTLECHEKQWMRGYYKGHRSPPASAGLHYRVIKNNYPKGNCNVTNSYCDWFTGIWNGFIFSNSYSLSSVGDLNKFFIPTLASDVGCASEAFTTAFTCDNGYDSNTGDFIAHCVFHSAKVITGTTFFRTNEHHQNFIIRNFNNGMQVYDSSLRTTHCLPLDRIDTDTVLLQLLDGFSNSTFSPDCSSSNKSPNLHLRCVDMAAAGGNTRNVGTVQWAFLIREKPASYVDYSDLYPYLSSANHLSFSLVLMILFVMITLF
jgi:hypothetical protein